MNLCRRGHDKDVVGRAANGGCQACREMTYRGGDGPSLRTLRLPVEPLVAVMPKPVYDGYGDNFGVATVLGPNLARSYHRAVKRGWISMSMVDDICGVLDRHPTEIWGNAWLD